MVIAYVIWVFLGSFGIHRIYLGRVKTGLLMMAMVFAMLAIFLVIGLIAETGSLNDMVLTVLSVISIGIGSIWFFWCLADVVLIAVMVNRDRKTPATYGTERMESVFK